MPSDVSMKIAERMLKYCFAYDNTQIEANKGIIADFLDVVGVGDSFEVCKKLQEGETPTCPDSCTCMYSVSYGALRKAGMV